MSERTELWKKNRRTKEGKWKRRNEKQSTAMRYVSDVFWTAVIFYHMIDIPNPIYDYNSIYL
jgi:hypothetical protein